MRSEFECSKVVQLVNGSVFEWFGFRAVEEQDLWHRHLILFWCTHRHLYSFGFISSGSYFATDFVASVCRNKNLLIYFQINKKVLFDYFQIKFFFFLKLIVLFDKKFQFQGQILSFQFQICLSFGSTNQAVITILYFYRVKIILVGRRSECLLSTFWVSYNS